MPAVTFGGIGSGMDVEGLIQGLIGLEREPIGRIQNRAASARAAVTSLSEVGGLLAELEKATGSLDTLQEVGSYKATSANEEAVKITAAGGAQGGTYDVKVLQLARSARHYSAAYDSASEGLGLNGTLTLQIGTGDLQDPNGNLLAGAATASIQIAPEASLNQIVSQINESGLRVQASTFFDGSQYRLQLRGLDAGADNALTIDQNGVTMGMLDEGNVVHQAQNALVEIDGIRVESKTNKISQSIAGVTLDLFKETDESFQVSIEQDPEGMATKLDDFVKAYNGLIDKVHKLAGFGSQKGTNPFLTGDSTLRGITNQLSRRLSTTFGNGQFNSLASVGIQLNNNGTLKLDSTKLNKVLGEDPTALTDLLAGSGETDGMMDILNDVAKSLNAPNGGLLSVRKDGLESRAKSLDDQVGREEDRIGRMEERLRKTFTQMDGTIASYNAQMQYLY